MTELDRACIDALRTCSFLPGSAPKRFARAMGEALDAARQISARQRATLYALVYRCRRQISTRLVARAAVQLAEAQATHELAREAAVVTVRSNPLDAVFAKDGAP